jgi:hypothetical protein
MRDDTRDPNGPREGYNYTPAPGEWDMYYKQARAEGATDSEAAYFADDMTSGGEYY